MKIIDKGSYEEQHLQCNYIVGYVTECPKCGEVIETKQFVEIPECYKCKCKKIPRMTPNRCKAVERTVFNKTKSERNKIKDDYYKEYAKANKKNLKDSKKLDEWYCNKHRSAE